MKRFLVALVALTSVAHAAPLSPAVTDDMVVSTTVVPACTISLTDFPLSAYDARVGLSETHPVAFQCTKDTTFKLFLRGFDGKLKNSVADGAIELNYELRNKDGVWTNDTSMNVVGTGAAQTETLTANIAAGQFVPASASAYTQAIQFALEF
jgi:hypothetical protein